MSTQVQYRRGTTSENNAFTGALAEITVDTTTNTLRVHDGVTAGGFPVAGTTATQTLTNKTLSAPTFTGAVTGNFVPSTDNTYTLGNATSSWSALYVAGNTIYLGNLQLKEASANTFAVFTSDGTTQANLDVGNIDVSALTQGTSTIGLAGVNGNAYVTVAGTANVLVVSSTGANVTGTLNTSGNANVGNLGTAGLITATGNITGGNLKTASVTIGNGPISGVTTFSASGNANVGNIGATNAVLAGTLSGVTTISASGNANVGNIGAAAAVFTGTASVTGNANVGNLGTSGLIVATGNVTGGNIVTAGQVVATGNVTGNFFIGNGSQLSGIDATSIQSGTSNVRVVSSGGNVTVGIAGTSNVVVINNATTTVSGNLMADMIFTANAIANGANINMSGYNGIMAGPFTVANGASFTVTTQVTIV